MWRLKTFSETFFGEHGERLAQPVEHRQRGRVGEVARRVGLHHVGIIEIAALRGCGFGGIERLLADASHAESGGKHESLLRAADADVDAPLVHAKIDAGQCAHGIHEEQRRMLDAVHRLAKGGDIAGDAGGGFVLAHQDGFDLVLLIGAERGQDSARWVHLLPTGFRAPRPRSPAAGTCRSTDG